MIQPGGRPSTTSCPNGTRPAAQHFRSLLGSMPIDTLAGFGMFGFDPRRRRHPARTHPATLNAPPAKPACTASVPGATVVA